MQITSKFPGKCKRCNERFPAGATIDYVRGVGGYHLTPRECSDARVERLKSEADRPTLDITPIVTFLESARARGLKNPKLRAVALDGRSEMTISITRGGVAPGSLAIVVAGDFRGCRRPNGQLTAALAQDVELQQYLVTIAANPVAAAKSYAALTGNCMFCGKKLEDDGSVEVGYGPVCASRYGLPHKPQGVRHLAGVL